MRGYGERGIRTPGILADSTVFETARFNRSRISPILAATRANRCASTPSAALPTRGGKETV